MSISLGAAALIGGASVLSNGVNALLNKFNNDRNSAIQDSINQANLEFANKQFEEQKYLNRNQVQLTASDMQKAGINPVMASGGASLSAGSYQSNQQANQLNPYQIDSSAIQTMAQLYMQQEQLDSQKKIASENNETNLEIAKINAEASNYSADQSYSASTYGADQSYSASKYATDRQVAEIKRHNQKAETYSRDQILQKQQQIWEDFALRKEQVQQAWTALQNAKKDSDRKFKLEIYKSALNTLKTVSSEAREWYDSLSYQNIFQKEVDSFDLPL